MPTNALPAVAAPDALRLPLPSARPQRLDAAPTPLRVALFTEQGHPEGTFTSGVTRLTRRLWSYCAEQGLPLDVFTYHERAGATARGTVEFLAVKPRTPIDFHGLKVDPWDILPWPNRALTRGALARAPYDVMLATAPGIGTQAQLVARRLGVPLVMLFTTDLPSYAAEIVRGVKPLRGLAGGAHGAAWAYLSWLYDRARTDLVLAPTRAFRAALEARVTAPVAVLGRGSDTLSFDAPADLRRGGAPTLLFVGRLDYGQKNLATLCRAVREIDGCRLMLVGEGEHRGRLERELAPEIAAGRVLLRGRIDDPDALRDAYRSADVFAFPSVFDTLGQVVVEAQRAGLPVVVRDRGGPPELVADGRSGFVAASDDEFIARCRALVHDRDLRVRMGGAAWEHARRLPTWSQVVERLLEHLRRAVRARRDGHPNLVLE